MSMTRPPGTGTVVGGTTGTLAATGANVMWWIALAIVLLIAGLLATHAVRKRTSAAQDESN